MENQNEHEFTFGKDGSEEEYLSDANNQKLAKLSQKVTLLSILIPCILGFLVIFLYFDITNKVGQVDSSGSTKVQNISKEFEKTILNLEAKSEELEKRVDSKVDKIANTLTGINNTLTGINNTLKGIKNKLKKNGKNISFLTSSKSNKKNINVEFKKIKKITDDIKVDLNSVTNQNVQLIQIAEKLKVKTDELESLKVSIKTLEAEIANQMNSFVNKKELNDSLKKQKRLFQLEIKDNYNEITKKIALLKFANQTNAKKQEVVEPKVEPKIKQE